MVVGTKVRDWVSVPGPYAIFPYDADLKPLRESVLAPAMRWLWPFRTNLSNSKMFSGETKVQAGLAWWQYGRLTTKKLTTPSAIAFAEIAPENNFVFFRREAVYAQTAPIVKLPDGSTEDDHLALLAVLNSSAVCFWMRDRSKPKGGAADVTWLRTHQYNSTRLEALPLPEGTQVERARRLDAAGHRLEAILSILVPEDEPVHPQAIGQAIYEADSERRRMIAEQEELDWEVYRLYGLVDERLAYGEGDPPELALGERAFEIALARKIRDGVESTTWFERHGSKPVVDIPWDWPEAYRQIVACRIDLIGSHPYLGLLERPDCKRRWASDSWDQIVERSLRRWLLGRLEWGAFWSDAQGRPTPKSLAVLADEVSRDPEIMVALANWEGRPDVPVIQSLERLIAGEAVPFLAAYRYKDAGLRKRSDWESTWKLQRRQDDGTYNPAPKNLGGDGPIPVPPKYAGADFARPEFWARRGKLDLPGERFKSYPGASREGDTTLVIGWAGWDHAQQSLALATLIQSGEQQGWPDDRLVPLVAGLAELLPWVKQWHSEPDALYGGSSPAEFFSELLDGYMVKLGATRESLAKWRPPAPKRRGRARS